MFWDDPFEIVSDVIDAIEDGVNEIVEGASDAAEAVLSVVVTVATGIVDVAEAIAEAVAQSLEKLGEIINEIAKAVEASVDAAINSLASVVNRVITSAEDLLQSVVSATKWMIEEFGDLADWVVNEALPFIYGLLKIGVALAIFLATLPFWLAAVIICTQVTAVYGHEHGKVLKAVADRYPRYTNMYKIRRLDAEKKYLIVSDNHRYSAGDLDIPSQQNDVVLYEQMLMQYANQDWTLIENGDVEDFWLRGGSGWEVAYDLATAFTGPSADAAREGGVTGIAALHLQKVLANPAYKDLYGTIKLHFHNKGRYFRTVGNHDDVYRNQKMVDQLGAVFPGITVEEFIVLANQNDEAQAIVTHGHQTDAWNSGACSFLGRTTTSITSAINSVLPDAMELGVPKSRLWTEAIDNTLTEVSPLVGATLDTDSLNEPNLHKTYTDTFTEQGPWLILGHTHAPRLKAHNPTTNTTWARYINDGAALFPGMITAVEWDGTEYLKNPANYTPKLIAWKQHNGILTKRNITATNERTLVSATI
jgi:UDP-2,3-diacylglucosamine pyrophosphatase LpxH